MNAEESGNLASNELLAEYSVTPSATPAAALRTPRTPANEDTILQEAQNLLALTNVETPLKGGENTPLHETSFDGMTPRKQVVQTPNVVLGTPLHTPGRGGMSVASTPRSMMMTPRESGLGASALTPLRDQLSINMEETMSVGVGGESSTRSFDSLRSGRQQQFEMKAQLRAGLQSLPTPRNNFEIVMPSDSDVPNEEPDQETNANFVEDAAEIDKQKLRELKEKGMNS